jgi:hypothetical protein
MRPLMNYTNRNSRFAVQANWSFAFVRIGKLHPPRKQDRT